MALTFFGNQKFHLREGTVFPTMLRLSILKARRSVRVDATAQFFISILLVQPFRKPVAHIPVKTAPQFCDGQKALKIPRRTLQNDRRPVSVPLQPDQTFRRHVVDKHMMFFLG